MSKKILIIDDEEDVHLIITEALASSGYAVKSMKSGTTGIALARAEKPDLILLDVMMPALDGFQVQQALKDDPTTKNIPIIFITARAALEDTVRAVTHGAVGYIEKPIDVHRLIQKVDSVFSKQSPKKN